MSNKAIPIYNSTNEMVKVCVKDSSNRETDAVITANEIWAKKDAEGCNTIIIIPLNPTQNTFYFTMRYPHGLVIQRKCGMLALVPCKQAPQSERDTTLRGYIRHGTIVAQNGSIHCGLCLTSGCLIFNDTGAPIWVCVSDINNRNTHIILDRGENGIVETQKQETSILKDIFTSTSSAEVTASNALEIVVSVIEANPINSANFSRKATYPTKSFFHESRCGQCTFLRVIKKGEYFMIEQDTIQLNSVIEYSNIPLSYLLTKDCCQKLRECKNPDIIKTNGNNYNVVSVNYDSSCCIQ